VGVRLSREGILRVLGNANERAKTDGEALEGSPSLSAWRENVRALQHEGSPMTYLAVLAVLLTARAMHDAAALDVRDIKAGTSEVGYSASSIGSHLAAFAKEQRIDLRATSTQPMNNQPFTFKARIEPEMGAQDKFASQWDEFYRIVLEVNTLTSPDAAEVLALLFHLARRVDAPTIHVRLATGGKSALDKVSAATAQFVADHSDNGKVGQAFVAAALDLLYGPDEVILGDTQDPDATTPGDVQVGAEPSGVWLWTEAKQKVIVTGDITGFLRKVQSVGGERVVYFALVNSGYSGHIQPTAIMKEAARLGMGVHIIDSPAAALEWVLPLAPGTYGRVAASLLERMHARMTQAGCASATLSAFSDLARRFAAVS